MLLQNQEDTLNVNQVQFNQLLLDAHHHFQLREMSTAIKLYEEALNCQEAGRDADRMAIILANLGIIYFHNCDYKQASTKLLEALNMLDKKNEFKCALMIKILGNLAIIKLITTDFQQCKDYNDQAIQLVYQVQPPFQYQLFKELMYIYFRFQSFESMGDGNFENLEQKYDGQSLACFYSSMGLNRELCGDMALAMRYHQKALKLWQELKENGFVVITLRRMITIAQNEKLEYKEYVALLQRCMQAPELKGISPEILFKDCDKKLQCAREVLQYKMQITASLQKMEQHLNYTKNQALLSKIPPVQDKDDFWKLALRLRLKRAIQYCYHQMSQEVENADLLQQSITQLEHSIKLLDQQQPYENYLQNLPFTKESVNIVKSHLIKFNRICQKILYLPFFNYFYKVMNQDQYTQPQKQNDQFFSQPYTQQFQSVTNKQMQDPLGSQYQSITNNQFEQQKNLKEQQFESQRYQQQQMFDSKQQSNQFNSGQFGSQQPIKLTQSQQQQQQKVAKPVTLKQSQTLVKSQKLKNTRLLDSAYRTVMLGDHLVKCHKSSNGRLDKFFLLANDNTFRWASKDKYINDPSKVSSYLVSDIRGIFYGKVTDVLRKSYNENLESWLCFSLIMKTRSMDFYVQKQQINPWMFALSEEIKRRNPKGFVITPGVMLWRKVKYILHWHFVDMKKVKDKKKAKKEVTYCKLILMFRENNLLLPKIK